MEQNYIPWQAEGDELIHISVYRSDTPVGPHMHDFIEIVFIAQGSCLHDYRQNQMLLIPGDVFVVRPHEAHAYAINRRTVIYNCLFYPRAIGQDLEDLRQIGGINCLLAGSSGGDTPRQEILHLNPADASYVESVLKRMLDEQAGRNSGFQVVQKSNLILLLAILGRLWDSQFKGQGYFFSEKRNELAAAMSYIDQNYADGLSVGLLASRAYMSPDHFRRVFKEATGLTAVDYINKVRIAKSIALLDDRSLTIGGVAERVGISDVNYFTRLFRLKLGYTPSEYRRKTEKC